jgi:hypothetical protein
MIGDRIATMTLTFKYNKDEKRVEVQKDLAGFKGKECTSLTEFIDKALGGKELEHKFKQEYYDDRNDFEGKIRA